MIARARVGPVRTVQPVPTALPDRRPQVRGSPCPPGSGAGSSSPAVFVCAACGLVYELELVALASYLVGDSVTQASVVLSVMVFAMGVGSLLAKRLRCRAATGFAVVEAVLALVGGCSAMALYASFAWFGGGADRARRLLLRHRRADRRGDAAADDAHPAHPQAGRGRCCRRPLRRGLRGRAGRRADLSLPSAAVLRPVDRCAAHRSGERPRRAERWCCGSSAAT